MTALRRQRLLSALGAIAVQVAIAALLFLSFSVVRHVVAEKETIITLNRVLPPPIMIDARGAAKARPRPAPPPSAPESLAPQAPVTMVPPVIAAPPAAGTASVPTGQAQGDCTPSNRIGVLAAQRVPCAPPTDPNGLPPQNRVKNEEYWAAERAASHTPPRVACISLTSSAQGQGGFQKEDHGIRLDLTCALAKWRNGLLESAPLPPRDDAPPAPKPPPPHVSDDAFQKSLQAVNARKRAAGAAGQR